MSSQVHFTSGKDVVLVRIGREAIGLTRMEVKELGFGSARRGHDAIRRRARRMLSPDRPSFLKRSRSRRI